MTDALALGVTTLTNAASYRTLCGAATPTAALSRTVKTASGGTVKNGALSAGKAVDGSSIDLSAAGYGIVGSDGLARTTGGVGYADTDVSVFVRLIMPRYVGTETPAEASDRAWGTASNIAEEIEAQIGSATGFADADVAVSGLFLDEEGVHRNHAIAEITITIRG